MNYNLHVIEGIKFRRKNRVSRIFFPFSPRYSRLANGDGVASKLTASKRIDKKNLQFVIGLLEAELLLRSRILLLLRIFVTKIKKENNFRYE